MAKGRNTDPSPMEYERVRMPNPRIERDRALREGEDVVVLPEAESETVEITTSGAAAKKGGK
jgi:hypothetical protein